VPVYGTKPSVYACFSQQPNPSGKVVPLSLPRGVPGS
jgi:hypothetical protein